jgi:PIN domain nuclease of toxin-antitoxin system
MTLMSRFPARNLQRGKAIRGRRASRIGACRDSLETNALQSLITTPEKVSESVRQVLSESVRQVLSEPSTKILVSAAPAWEIAIKSPLGPLHGDPPLSVWFHIIADMTAVELPIDAGDAVFAGQLPWDPKDPLDRVIVAQAARRNLTIATSDTQIQRAALTPTLAVALKFWLQAFMVRRS